MEEQLTLGLIIITYAAHNQLCMQDVHEALGRHARCDWGDVTPQEALENGFSFHERSRVHSRYHDRNGRVFRVFTDGDGTATMVLMEDEWYPHLVNQILSRTGTPVTDTPTPGPRETMTTAAHKRYSLLTITSRTDRTGAPGTWVQGVTGSCDFMALVFPVRASNPEFEIRPGCRISKLEVRREGRVIASFERGWDLKPTEGDWDVVAFLVTVLADVVFGPEQAEH